MSRTITRRGFLAGGAAAMAAPLVITSEALGSPTRPPASERVTVGLLGCGSRASHVRAAGGQAVAVCDPWKDRREQFASRLDCRAYADFRDLLARDDIDAVVITAPDHWHVPLAIAAAQAGKHMYVEKPLGTCVLEDLRCREAIKRYGAIFQYGAQSRSTASARHGCEMVRNGVLGEIREIIVSGWGCSSGGSLAPLPVPDGLDYDMWLGSAPWRPYCGQAHPPTAWYFDYDYGYGISWYGAHALDLLVWAYDTHRAGTWEVEGSGSIPTEGRYNVPTSWNVRYQFANGVKMTYRSGGLSVKFIGQEGWLEIPAEYVKLKAEPASLLGVKLGPDRIRLVESRHHGDNFIEAVKSRITPVGNIEDAVHADLVGLLADIAIRAQRKIKWDPVMEEILDDPYAARMMCRAMRQPWTF